MTRIINMQYLAAVILLTVFIINIVTPPTFVIDILYLCSIVLVFKQNTKTIIYFSGGACALIIINALFFDGAIDRNMSLWINRLISLFAIVITSYIAIHYRKQTRAGTLKDQQYVTAIEAMLFMMSHQVRKPVANILGLVETMQTESCELSAGDIQELCRHFYTSAVELDNFIKELNIFIEQAEQQNQV